MLKEQIMQLVEEKIAGTDCFLVEVKVSPSKIRVSVDKPAGIKIDECVEVSRFLQQRLEDSDVLEHRELEVSSPGMDEPLKVLQQYHRRIGKEVSVVTYDGLKHSGILVAANEEGIDLHEKIKKENRTVHLPFTDIKETKVVFSFQ